MLEEKKSVVMLLPLITNGCRSLRTADSLKGIDDSYVSSFAK